MVRKIAGTGAVLSITDDPEILREGPHRMALDGKRIVFTIDNSRAVTAGARAVIAPAAWRGAVR